MSFLWLRSVRGGLAVTLETERSIVDKVQASPCRCRERWMLRCGPPALGVTSHCCCLDPALLGLQVAQEASQVSSSEEDEVLAEWVLLHVVQAQVKTT